MNKSMSGVLKVVIAVMLTSVIGVGLVFALNQKGQNVEADSAVILKTVGMTCVSCAKHIESALLEKAGVAAVEVDVEAGRVTVAYDSRGATPEALAAAVTGIGYDSSVLRTMTVGEYRAATGKESNTGPAKPGCACCARSAAGK